jgi:thiopeptide-type bacteriocin biosynthesis protein
MSRTRARGAAFAVDARFCYRTPLLPLSVFTGLGTDVDGVRARLRALVDRPDVREAIFIASPDLHDGIASWQRDPDGPRGQDVERSLLRYVSRMAGRATPFGAFSGVSTAAWAERTQLPVGPASQHRRRTRLDHDYLDELCDVLRARPEIRDRLRYTPSSSLYVAGGRVRYVEERVKGRRRSHHLVSVEPTPHLAAALERARLGATRQELVDTLLEAVRDVSTAEAESFVDQLIDCRLLVGQLAPHVTGDEGLRGVIDCLRRADQPASVAILEAAQADMESLDRARLGAPPGCYRAIADRLRGLPAPVDIRRLFQVDVVVPAPGASLNRQVADEIAAGVALLHRISRRPAGDALATFRGELTRRYGTRSVPLAEALDEESGIGFGAAGWPSDAIGLLAGIPLSTGELASRVADSPADRHLMRLLTGAIARREDEICLSDGDVAQLACDDPRPMPGAMAVMAAVIAGSAAAVDRGDYRLLLEPAGGPSGMRLLGRFCHADPDVEEMVREHIRREEARRPDAIHAEVVHLPEGRMGNVLARPVLRGHEIPYLGVSGAPLDRQIAIDDLFVHVDGARVVLTSRRLGREVLPRLTTAHNSHNGLGLYRFLCALQGQGTSCPRWSWGALEASPYLPRVTCGRLVLARARWRLDRADLDLLPARSDGGDARVQRERQLAGVAELRRRRELPRFVVLADGDKALPVDLENPLSADSFARLVRARPSAQLVELYPGPDELVAEGGAGRFVHELVVPMVQEAVAVRADDVAQARPELSVARSFPPGSGWLFAKLYAGAATLDELLAEVVAPTSEEARRSGAADSWFFIRYGDPDPHLRVRYRGAPERLWSELLPALGRRAAPLIDAGVMWRFELATYEREVERFGGPAGMELCESLFAADSDAVVAMVADLTGASADDRWRIALRGMDDLLADLGYAVEQRHRVVEMHRDGLAREYRADTAAFREMGARYRAERGRMATLLGGRAAGSTGSPGSAALTSCLDHLARRSERARPLGRELRARAGAGQLAASLDDIARSLVHLHLNRLLRSSQRAQELVLCDLLRRHYESLLALRRTRAP